MLLGTGFLDELAGVGPVAAPDIRAGLGLSYATAALVLFTIPQGVSMLVEPPLLWLALKLPRRVAVGGGLAAMGASLLACGFATGPVSLAIATTCAWLSSGVGINLSEAALIDGFPQQRERLSVQLNILGAVGDLSTPVLVAALSLWALGWREAFWIVGALLCAYGALLTTRPLPSPPDDDDEASGSWRDAVRNTELMRWLFGATLCNLLDEVFVAFAALYLAHRFVLEPAATSLSVAAFTGGCMVGLLVLDRLLARGADSDLTLRRSALGCAGCFAVWLAAPTVELSIAALALLGVLASPLYPLAIAKAYAALPGRAGMVQVLGGLFAPLDLGLPLLVGWVADQYGLTMGLLLLLLQPLVLLTLGSRRASPRPRVGLVR